MYVTGLTKTGQHVIGYPNLPVEEITTVAYNATTGTQLWASQYEGNSFYAGFGAPPMVAVSPNGAQVFVGAGYCVKPVVCSGHPYGQTVLGYNATTGAGLWATVNADGAAPDAMTVSPNGSYLLLSGDLREEGYVTSMLSTENGGVFWSVSSVLPPRAFHYEPPASITVSPDESTVFVTGTQGTVALNLDGGVMLWKRYSAGSVGTSLAVSQDSSVLAVAGCQPPVQRKTCSATQLTAYNAATGAYLWSLADGATSVVASLDGPQMFVASDKSGRDAITGYDIAQGTHTQLWQTPSIGGRLALNRNGTTVFAGLGTGTVASYNAATGTLSSSVTYSFAGTMTAMGISANGSKLFVTGTGSSPGYLTTAYSF